MHQRPSASSRANQPPNYGQSQVSEQQQTFDVSVVLFNAGVNFMKRNKKLTSAYFLGLLILLFATGFSVSAEQEIKYTEIMSEFQHEEVLKAERSLFIAEQKYYRSKGFFTCNAYCMEQYRLMLEAEAKLRGIQSENDVIASKAKSHVGIFSVYGVQEARDMFWRIFAKGRGFAQTSSWYDIIFMGIDTVGRDESLVSVFIRWVLQLIINFTVGMIGTFVAFVYSLWGMITSYQPSLVAAVIFFGLAIVAASSLIVSFLAALYFSAAGTVFVAAKAAGPNLRIGGTPRYRARYIRHQYQYGRY